MGRRGGQAQGPVKAEDVHRRVTLKVRKVTPPPEAKEPGARRPSGVRVRSEDTAGATVDEVTADLSRDSRVDRDSD
jgi:hypothetical protein